MTDTSYSSIDSSVLDFIACFNEWSGAVWLYGRYTEVCRLGVTLHKNPATAIRKDVDEETWDYRTHHQGKDGPNRDKEQQKSFTIH